MQSVLDILTVVVVFLVLIGFHELGHLLTAKFVKIPVEKFSIGFGPGIFKWGNGETVYQLSVIPLGGYVKFKGEDFDDPKGFFAFPFWRKTVTTAGGIITNFILAILIYFIIGLGWGVEIFPPVLDFPEKSVLTKSGFMPGDSVIAVNGKQIHSFSDFTRSISNKKTVRVSIFREGRKLTLSLSPSDSMHLRARLTPRIGNVQTNSPAAKAGLKKGDLIIAIDSMPIKSWVNLLDYMNQSDTLRSFKFIWLRNNDTFTANIQPETLRMTKQRGIGIVVASPTRPIKFGEALWLPVRRTLEITGQTFVLLGRLITGKESARNLGGVILIADLSAQSRRWGLSSLLSLLAYLSISLAVVNMLPIPALDGGRILIFIIEKIRGKNFGKMVWTISINIGFIVLLLLVGFTLFNDISRLITGG